MELKVEVVSRKSFRFDWKDEFTSTQVEIILPELKNLSVKKWADWGPMYHFALDSDHPIQFSINGETRALDQSILRIESPAAAAEREKYPFCIFVEDAVTEARFKLFLDSKFELALVEVKRRRERVLFSRNSSEDREPLSEAM